MPEHNRFAHASKHAGRMHGCGHDGHTTMLLGTARYLAETRNFDGTVHLIFQPAEEGLGGARAMIEDGLFKRFPCDEIYGIHNMPGFPTGHFAFRKGPAMASSNRFDIIVRGTGGHAAQPHKAVDTIVIAAELVGALQTLIARHKNPIDVAVVSVTQIHAGDAYNVLPEEAVIKGTVRTFSTEVLDQIEDNMRRMAEKLPQAHGGSGELKFHRAYPPLVNWDAQTEFAMKVAQDAFGADKVDGNTPQHGGAEDFSFYLLEVPGSYLFLGNGEGAHREEKYIGMGPCELHNPNYDFNDALLPIGATYWVKVVGAFFGRLVGRGEAEALRLRPWVTSAFSRMWKFRPPRRATGMQR
jgi:hippurate hydrolase